MLPEFSPINRDTFNYAPIAVGVVLLFSGGYWLLWPASGSLVRKVQGDEAELERHRAGVHAHRA